MPDYKNGKIYTIRYRNDDSLIYVGSTTNSLAKRFHDHKRVFNNEKQRDYNMPLYQKMRQTNDIDNWYIELFEEHPCENRNELNRREGQIIREMGTINKYIAGRTREEYKEDNKLLMVEYRQAYYQKNIDKQKQQVNQWYNDNKEKVIEQRKQKSTCCCGGIYNISNKSRHCKSKKHQEFLTTFI